MGKIIISIFIYCITYSVFATKYYVSSSMGNDTNDGLTSSTAWKTISKVQSERNSFQPGDIISLKRGDIWVEELYLDISGTASKPITFTSYGTGVRPILTVVEEQHLTWVNIGGNIWRNTNINKNPKRLLIDGVEVLGEFYKYNNLGTHVPDLIQWYYGDNGDGNNFIYIYSLIDPNTRTIESTTKERVLYLVLSNYLNFENIEFQGGYYETVSVYGCDNITFNNIKIGVMSNNGLNIYRYSSGGTNFKQSKNIIVDNCTFDTEFTLDYSSAGTYDGASVRGTSDGIKITSCLNSEIKNSTFKNWGHSSMSLTTDNDTDEISGFKIYKNYSTAPNIPYGSGLAFDGVNTHNNEMFENHFYKTKDSQINGSNNHVHHNIFEELKNSSIHKYPSGRAISLQSYYEGSYNNIIENNLMVKCDGPGIFIAGGSTEFVKGNIIRNNIIYECGSDYHNIGLELYKTGSANSNNNNIFQNNLVYSSGRSDPIYYYNDYLTSTVFNSRDGDDYGNKITNNIEGNVYPSFINDANNWHLKENSPAINAGVKPLSTKDYDGNDIPNNGTLPDIGIYEYYENTTGSINANAGEDQTICQGESVTLTASGGSTYSWSTGATTQSITVNPNAKTTYTVTVSEGSASDSDQVQVTVNSVTAGAGGNQTIESGQSVTLTASGGDSYEWNTGETTQSITVSPVKTTTYTVTAKKGECEGVDSVLVTVNQNIVTNPPPANAYAGEDVSICSGQSVTLTASGGETYLWDTGDTQQSIKVNPTRTTTYSLSATRGGVTNTDQVIVTVDNCTNASLQDDIIENKLLIYPNPTDGRLNVKLGNTEEAVQLEVMNINGSIIQSERVESINDRIEKQMDLSRLSKGIYYVRLNNSSYNGIKKILVY